MESPTLSMLRRIWCDQPITRLSLGDRLGLSGNRVSVLVSQLVEECLVCEEAIHDRTPGRPPRLLTTNPAIGRVVGLDIGGEQSRAVLADMNGVVVASLIRPTQALPDPALILDNLVHLVEEVCRAGASAPGRLAALGVDLRAIVDTQQGVVRSWPTPAPCPCCSNRTLATSSVWRPSSRLRGQVTSWRFGSSVKPAPTWAESSLSP